MPVGKQQTKKYIKNKGDFVKNGVFTNWFHSILWVALVPFSFESKIFCVYNKDRL